MDLFELNHGNGTDNAVNAATVIPLWNGHLWTFGGNGGLGFSDPWA
jgi:hypothetical protein